MRTLTAFILGLAIAALIRHHGTHLLGLILSRGD